MKRQIGDADMGNYGKTATIAVSRLANAPSLSPRDAWKAATGEVFPDSPSSQAKSCPRDTFLALCETGGINNVAAGVYTRSTENKRYALRALDALRADPRLSEDQRALWKIAVQGEAKVHNSQMDVVATLYRSSLLKMNSIG